MATIPQTIIDVNGHQKVVHINPDKAAGRIDTNGVRRVASLPALSSAYQPTATVADVQKWAARNHLPLSGDEQFMELVLAAAEYSGDTTDQGLRDSYDRTFSENFGGYTVESLRAALSLAEDFEKIDLPKEPFRNMKSSQEITEHFENGGDWDGLPPFILHNDTAFCERDILTSSKMPREILIVTPMFTADEDERFQSHLAYVWKSVFHEKSEIVGERVNANVYRVAGFSAPDGWNAPLERFEDTMEDFFANGTPLRQDNTRAVEAVYPNGTTGYAFYYAEDN